MAQIRCPFCHQYVDKAEYTAHAAKHTLRRPDGQQTDYVTLPKEDREPGDLTGVPRVYVHRKCGVATGMPEEIIRSYLKNPYMYSDKTFCCGCGGHVPLQECEWVETGQDLQSYNDELRRSKPEMKPKRGCFATVLLFTSALLLGIVAYSSSAVLAHPSTVSVGLPRVVLLERIRMGEPDTVRSNSEPLDLFDASSDTPKIARTKWTARV